MANTKIKIAAVGSKSDGINEINPRFQAEALRNIRGVDCGVLDNSFYSSDGDPYGVKKDTNANFMFRLTVEEDKVSITVGRGMATAYGYDFQTEEDISITADDSGHSLTSTSGATQYCFVYLEWDLSTSPNTGDIKVHNNGTASIWRSLLNSNANLIENPTGVYKLPIYRFTVTSTGIDSGSVVSWEDMNLCPTITRPQVAEVARYAVTPDDGDYDAAANVKYVEDKCNENLEKMNDVLNVLYQSFNSVTFYILGVALTAERQNALTVIYAPSRSITSSGQPDTIRWNKLLSEIDVGDNLCCEVDTANKTITGEATLPQIYRPTEDTTIRIAMYYYLSSAAGSSGSETVYVTFQTDGKIVLAETLSAISYGATYPYFAIGDNRFHIGWKNKNADEVTNDLFLCRPVTNNIPSTVKACIPEYFELNKTYTLNIEATDYAKWVNAVTVRYTLQEDTGSGGETRSLDLRVTLNAAHTQVTFTTPKKPTADTDDILNFTISATVTNYDNGTDDT